MTHSTPQTSTPREQTLDYLRKFARIYRPEEGVTLRLAALMAQIRPAGSC